MLTLHTVRTSFPSPRRSSPHRHALQLSRRRFSICKSSSEDAGSDAPLPHGGDQRQQEVLAKIAMLQTQKVRITNFLDERSAYLTKFTKDADTEFDMIGQNAMKELDQIGDQIMERLDSKMQSYEETAEMQRQEIEMNERVLEDFEDWIEEEKNEGMFFKSLGKVKKPQNNEEIKVKAKIEAQKVREIAEESAGSKTRMNIYLALMAILGLTIANAVFATPEVEWRKVAALGLIFIGLVAQVIYEQDISPPVAWAGANAQVLHFQDQMLSLQQLDRVDGRLLLWVNFSIAWLLKPSMRRIYQQQKLGLMATPITIVSAVFATPEVKWRDVAPIFTRLVPQVIYEQCVSPPEAWANANAWSYISECYLCNNWIK